jgi:general secretion pathway protein A
VYEAFFGLREKPFALTPNPRFLFYTDRYRAAFESLRFGLQEKEGFLLLTGPVGTGKTTLCRDLLRSLDPARHRTALVFNPFLSAAEMLQALLSEFGCSYSPDAPRKELLDRLNRFLLTQLVEGRTCTALFDEAQHLSPELLEQIRVLSNLETESEKLVQIVLVGQPELRERIQHPSLAQLDQRISLRSTLGNLSREETERYVYHRLNVAGAQGRIQFTRRALRRIFAASGGVPRLVNLVCDRSLLAAYVARTTTIGHAEVKQALGALHGGRADQELSGRLRARGLLRPAVAGAGAALLAGLGTAAVWALGGLP